MSAVQIDLGPAPNVTLPAAAYAARVDARVLKRWLDEGFPLLASTYAPRRWNRFAPVDVARFAVAGTLVSFGFTAPEAADLLRKHVDSFLDAVVAVASGGSVPWTIIHWRLRGLRLTISRERDGIAVSVEHLLGTCRVLHNGRARIHVDVGAIAADVERRLADPAATKRALRLALADAETDA